MNNSTIMTTPSADTKSVLERYVFKPLPGSSHAWALRHLEKVPANATVLDVGPGSGAMGKALRQQQVHSLYAIDIDEATRLRLADTYQELWASIDEAGSLQFDLVLMLDVLEHMTDPFEFFAQVVSRMKPGAHALISLPNVAHWGVRLPLLFGSFRYTNRGLLDRTHYQFFNRARVRELVASQPSLTAREFAWSIDPIELVFPESLCNNRAFFLLSKFRQLYTNLLPGLFGYQHLVHVVKDAETPSNEPLPFPGKEHRETR